MSTLQDIRRHLQLEQKVELIRHRPLDVQKKMWRLCMLIVIDQGLILSSEKEKN